MVAQFVPTLGLWIVRCAHCINIVAFHRFNIQQHGFLANYMPGYIVMFVQVYPFHVNVLPVNEELSIFNFHFAETDILTKNFQNFAIFIEHRNNQIVKIWRFCCPFFYRRNFCRKRYHSAFSIRGERFNRLIAIQKFSLNFCGIATHHFSSQFKNTVVIVVG